MPRSYISNCPPPLLSALTSACSSGDAFGSMSPSIYDTAWLSMVQNPAERAANGIWTFPECFDYIIERQLPDGGWTSYATVADGILNTAAALLAVRKRLSQCPDSKNGALQLRSEQAQKALRAMLEQWDISSCDQVGFEILLFRHLSLLAADGVTIEFTGRSQLKALYDAKLAKLSGHDLLQAPSTLLHSLEAMIGKIDFDEVRCWREDNGSMMNSPSSTAAYLMHTSIWDQDAENYLRAVLARETGPMDGSVPCAWPTTVFEVSWAVTTLAYAGFRFQSADSSALCSFLENALSAGQGLVGFSISSIPDADDTAKTIMALRYLREQDTVSVKTLVQTFESSTHFLTYPGERNPSISTNCNVLMCLCMLDDPMPYASQITKAASYLCEQILSGSVGDKWHHHELYWMMLLAQAFECLYRGSSSAAMVQEVSAKCPVLFREHIPITSLQVIIRILTSQEADGSWGGTREPTAYAVLALSSFARLPWIESDLEEYGIIPRIKRAKLHLLKLSKAELASAEHLWVEKVTYASEMLSQAYCCAAIHMKLPEQCHGPHSSSHISSFFPHTKLLLGMRKAGVLMACTPLLNRLDKGLLHAAELQACYALCDLERQKLDIFPRKAMRKDTYLTLVPLTWTVCNALHCGKTSFNVLREMMVLSMLVYQADEYIEGVVERDLNDRLELVRSVILRIFSGISPKQVVSNTSRGVGEPIETPCSESEQVEEALQDAETVLRKFVIRVLKHPAILQAAKHQQIRLAGELETFFLAHLTQAGDNGLLRHPRQNSHNTSRVCVSHHQHRLIGDSDANGEESALGTQEREHSISADTTADNNTGVRSFYKWVRSTSADHTSCPFAFTFFDSLAGSNLFACSAKTAYVAEDLCRHLSSMCRMYNDYGCVERDHEEFNLNSIDFPDFYRRENDACHGGNEDEAKGQLMWIAEYERRATGVALAHLEEHLGGNSRGQGIVDSVKLFVDVTDLYGLIYLIKDVTPRSK